MSACKCGSPRATLYAWPGNPEKTEWLCSGCVSGLCEWCGEGRVAWSLGARDAFHVCEACAVLSKFKRRRRRRKIVHKVTVPCKSCGDMIRTAHPECAQCDTCRGEERSRQTRGGRHLTPPRKGAS